MRRHIVLWVLISTLVIVLGVIGMALYACGVR